MDDRWVEGTISDSDYSSYSRSRSPTPKKLKKKKKKKKKSKKSKKKKKKKKKRRHSEPVKDDRWRPNYGPIHAMRNAAKPADDDDPPIRTAGSWRDVDPEESGSTLVSHKAPKPNQIKISLSASKVTKRSVSPHSSPERHS